jgi:hypothetical protein
LKMAREFGRSVDATPGEDGPPSVPMRDQAFVKARWRLRASQEA